MASQYVDLPLSGGVTSVNGLTGAITLAAGANITLTPVGNTITIAATDTDTGITQLTGDVTAGPGSGSQVATIANNVVTNAKLAQMPTLTIKGNNTGGTANALDLTVAQVVTMLNSTLVHSTLSGLTTGDAGHTQFALLAGRSGGQTLAGSTVTAQNLTLRPNSADTTTGSVIITGPQLDPTANNTTSLGTASIRYATLFSNRIANYVSTTVTPTVSGAVLLSGRFNNTGGGTTTVSVSSLGTNAANFLMGSVRNTTAGTATYTVSGGGNFGGGGVDSDGTYTVAGLANFVWAKAAGNGANIITDIASDGSFVYGSCYPGAVGTATISAAGTPSAAGCFVGGWIQGSDTSATPSLINGSNFGCFAQGMIVDGGNIGAGSLGGFSQGYCTTLGAISTTGDGGFSQGYAENGGIINAAGPGTVAHGAVVGAFSIQATGNGSGAFGYSSSASILATADNAFQFAEGTNSTANSLQVGVSGTGIKIYGSGQIDIPGVLNHDGTTLGFYAVTPVTRPAAYTQTYATATRTQSNLTSATLTDSTTGTANTTVTDVGAAFNQATLNNNFADLIAQVNALRVDLVNVKGVLNQVIDDLQANGLLQ